MIAIVKFLVSDHIEIACSGEAEEYCLVFACLAALDGLVNRQPGWHALLSGAGSMPSVRAKNSAASKHLGLLHGRASHEPLVIELARGPGSCRGICRPPAWLAEGIKPLPSSVHLGQRANLARVAEVIGEHAAGEARAAAGSTAINSYSRSPRSYLAHEGADRGRPGCCRRLRSR